MIRLSQFGAAFLALSLVAAPAVAQEAHKPEPRPAKAPSAAEVGQPAPDFSLAATDGKTYKLADLKDKLVVLEWINRDCPVCKAQEPKLKETASALLKRGVVWLAIDSTATHKLADNTEHVKKAALPYPILDDSAGAVGRAYGVKCTPTVFIINKGVVAYSGALIPQGEGSRNYVADAADELLAGKPVSTPSTKAYGCSVKYKNN